MSGYEVVTKAVRSEAGKWRKFADQVEPVHRAVRDEAHLGFSAFFVGDPALMPGLDATLHTHSYEGFRSFVESVLAGAVIEFDQIGDALIKIAEAYERKEKLNLNQIYGK